MSGPNRRRRGYLRSLALLFFVCLLAAPAGAFAQQATPAGGKTLVGAFDAGPGGCPECFNPLTATAGFTWLEKYYSKLVLYDVDFTKIQGDLAESWEIAPDGKTYTFKLRPGVTWHDGQPFTAADVKFTIELAKTPDSASYIGAKFNGVSSIDTPDDHTVVLHLDKPNAALLDALTFLVMLPQHALASIAPKDLVKSDWWHTDPIGTGPFKWSQYQPGQYVELTAFDHYWRGRPKIDTLIDRFYPEAGSSVIALRAGEIQFTYLTSDEAKSLGDDAALKILSGPSQVANYLGFNMTDPRFKDLRVRQAFMYAIDRKAIVDQLYGGSATVIPCVFHQPQFQPKDVEAYAPDPAKAKQLLQEANWDQIKGQPIEVVTYYGDQLSNDVLVTMQQMLADVGIDITIRTVDTPTFNDIIAGTDWTMFYGGGANGPDPDVTSTYFLSTDFPPNGANRVRYANPDLDKLYLQGRQEIDPGKRAAIYQQICGLLNQQLPWAPMWVGNRFGGVATTVGNFIWTPAPGGGRYYDAAETWTVGG
jgi:peptide/nickel transport system substrate-binding protein